MKGYSQKYVCEDYVWNKDYKITRNTGFYILRQEFQRDAPANDMLVLNKSSLGLGT